MENTRIAHILEKIADLSELRGDNEFRVRSYRNSARTIRDLSENVEDMAGEGTALTDLPNIGKGIADKIREIIDRGTCKKLEDLEKELPGELTRLLEVPQLGPKKAAQLHRELSIQSLDDLKKAAEHGKIRDLAGMGAKTEENILAGLKTLEASAGRITIHEASDYVRSVTKLLNGIEAVKQWEIAGSYRRGKETVGDLDILVHTDDRKHVSDEFLKYDAIDEAIGRGSEKMSVRLTTGLQIDVRFFEEESFGSALMYFTGSKAHNIALRRVAQERNWKLNEYGLFKDDNRLAGKTEESVYHRLDIPWIPPELREDRGEIEAAQNGDLPELITKDDIRGDLHAHTKLTDGKNTLEEMADAARSRGYEYLAITEHSKAVTVAQGLDEDAILKHADDIRELNDNLDDLWLMPGIEVDILKSGKLDLDENVLSHLDWVTASVHSYFKMDEKEMTDRIIRAIKSGVIHCLGHLTGRMIADRDPVAIDLERIFDACLEHGVALEINAQPDRLDLSDVHCRRAKAAGVPLVIATDAHQTSEFDFVRYGLLVARRGWLEKDNVLNTKTARQLRDYLKKY